MKSPALVRRKPLPAAAIERKANLPSGPRSLTSGQPSYSSSLTFAIQSTALPSSAS